MAKTIGTTLMAIVIMGLFCTIPLIMISEELGLMVLRFLMIITLLAVIIAIILNRIEKNMIYPKPKI